MLAASLIPLLEPGAVLPEFAWKATRLDEHGIGFTGLDAPTSGAMAPENEFNRG
jgi:hypothetical protein